MNREPAATIGAVSAAVASILACLVAFGLDITPDQQTAILAVIAGVGPIVVALLIRPAVSSPATVAQVAADAHKDGREEATTIEVQPAYPTRREYHAD